MVQILSIHGATLDIFIDCASNLPAKHFFELFKGFMKKLDLINGAESVTNLMAMARDGFAIDISGNESRYFYDGVSFSDLEYKENEELNEIVGEINQEILYNATVNEKTNVYNFPKTNKIFTQFNKVQSMEGAGGLPFKITVEGDAVPENQKIESLSGVLKTVLTLGNENSIIKIEPDFKNSGINPDFVDLIINDNSVPIFNTWGPYCAGDEVPSLPATSANGIEGTVHRTVSAINND